MENLRRLDVGNRRRIDDGNRRRIDDGNRRRIDVELRHRIGLENDVKKTFIFNVISTLERRRPLRIQRRIDVGATLIQRVVLAGNLLITIFSRTERPA